MKIRSALIAVLALVFGTGAAQAQAPSSLLQMSMDYDGMLYPLNLIPVKVLVIHSEGRAIPGGYVAAVSMKSYGILRVLKRVDIDAQVQGHHGDDGLAHPNDFTYIHHDGKRIRHVHVVWTADDVQMTSTPPFNYLGDPPATRAQKLAATDPLTRIVRMANATGPDAICSGPQRFFDGKQLYALDFGPAEPSTLTNDERALGLTRVGQCTVRFTEVAGFKPKPPNQRNQGLTSPITMVFGQVGPDGPWVFFDIHANTVIGYADIVLRKITVTGRRPRA